MIDINLISEAMTSGAGTNLYAYTAEVSVKFGANNSQPAITHNVSVGQPFINGATVLFPCSLNIVLTYTNSEGVVTHQQIITENFTVGTSSNVLPTTQIVTDLGAKTTLLDTRCCGKSYKARFAGSFSLVTT